MSTKPRDLFLSDEEGHAQRLLGAFDALSSNRSDMAVEEIARLLHTIKGNAAAFGFVHLSKYAHALESLLSVAREGRIPFDDQTVSFLRQYAAHIGGAMAIYRADPESPLTLKEKLTEIVGFLKTRLENARLPEVESVDDAAAEDPAPSDLAESVPEIKKPDNYVLVVTVGGVECWVPTPLVVEVIHRPEIVPVLGALLSSVDAPTGLSRAKLVRFGHRLMPLLSPTAFFSEPEKPESTDLALQMQARANVGIPWAVLLRDDSLSPRFESWFCLPVDDIIEVRELKTELSEETLTLSSDKLRATMKRLEAA